MSTRVWRRNHLIISRNSFNCCNMNLLQLHRLKYQFSYSLIGLRPPSFLSYEFALLQHEVCTSTANHSRVSFLRGHTDSQAQAPGGCCCWGYVAPPRPQPAAAYNYCHFIVFFVCLQHHRFSSLMLLFHHLLAAATICCSRENIQKNNAHEDQM